jgi:hypothetical protein
MMTDIKRLGYLLKEDNKWYVQFSETVKFPGMGSKHLTKKLPLFFSENLQNLENGKMVDFIIIDGFSHPDFFIGLDWENSPPLAKIN